MRKYWFVKNTVVELRALLQLNTSAMYCRDRNMNFLRLRLQQVVRL